jgi:hypothetical protein
MKLSCALFLVSEMIPRIATPVESRQPQQWPAMEDRWVRANVSDGTGLRRHRLIVFKVTRDIAADKKQRDRLHKRSVLWTYSWSHGSIRNWTLVGPDLVVASGKPLGRDEVGLLVPREWWWGWSWAARLLIFLRGRGWGPSRSYFRLESSDRSRGRAEESPQGNAK